VNALHRVHMNLDPGGTEPGTARLVFPVTLLLKDLLGAARNPGGITVSIVRFSGDTSPSGDVIRIGEVRLELSLDAVA
jgi:tyrosinase